MRYKMSDNKFKSGFVAILGRPNVGKSTIMNHLVGMKIAAVSKRAQTTRKKIQTVYTDDRGQIVFLDTPGVNRAETKLGEYMMDAAVDSLKTADIIMWIVEPSTFIGTGERLIAEMIGKTVRSLRSKKEQDEDGAVNCPVILVVNKADTADDAGPPASHSNNEGIRLGHDDSTGLHNPFHNGHCRGHDMGRQPCRQAPLPHQQAGEEGRKHIGGHLPSDTCCRRFSRQCSRGGTRRNHRSSRQSCEGIHRVHGRSWPADHGIPPEGYGTDS